MTPQQLNALVLARLALENAIEAHQNERDHGGQVYTDIDQLVRAHAAVVAALS